MSASSLALSNLRAIVILIVLGFHAMLAYLVWVPIAAATDLTSPPYAWRAFPIIDDHRFFGFDLFCAWQDALLAAAPFAVIEAAIVFGGTLVLSWIAVLAVQRIPFGAQLIGAPRRAVATS
jgi:hypothetical protein